MSETTDNMADAVELADLGQEATGSPTPAEEHRRARKRRRGMSLLFVLLVLVEGVALLTLLGTAESEDLHYRVTKEIENSISGENTLETGVYVGDTDFGYFTGQGVFTWDDGAVYSGEWADNRIHGVGTLNVPSEGTYKGGFLRSAKSGQGVFTWDDGAVYSGEWADDKMSGQGTYTGADGSIYVGTFRDNGLWEGTCEFENESGSYVFEFKESEIVNLSAVFPDGTRYDGETDGETLSGFGVMKFANGDGYRGNFQEGCRAGLGTYSWGGGAKYEGAWAGDKMSGSGTYTYPDGSFAQGWFGENQFINGTYEVTNAFGEYSFEIKDREAVSVEMTLVSGTKYSGDVKNGVLTGAAQIEYSNGDKYSGDVENGRKSGQGIYAWSSGASYDGEWANDKMSGQGTYFYSEGESGYKLAGSFSDGSPTGECQYYVSESESYKTDWSNGRCVKVYE